MAMMPFSGMAGDDLICRLRGDDVIAGIAGAAAIAGAAGGDTLFGRDHDDHAAESTPTPRCSPARRQVTRSRQRL